MRIVCFTFSFFIMTQLAAQTELYQLLPSSVDGWKETESKMYNPKTLYDYINGGAELYISYEFSHVLSRNYKNDEGEEVQVEIFDMQEPENAYGVFSQQREEETHQFGQGSQVVLGSIIFWKDRYFISMMNHNETPSVKEGMKSIAGAIDQNIKSTGNKPEIIQFLPTENLDETSIRYFKHYIWLNSYYYISGENYFNINEETDAVLARYNFGEVRPIVLVIEYPSADDCHDVWTNLNEMIKPSVENANDILFEMDAGTISGLAKDCNVVMGVFQASSKEIVKNMIAEIKNQLEND